MSSFAALWIFTPYGILFGSDRNRYPEHAKSSCERQHLLLLKEAPGCGDERDQVPGTINGMSGAGGLMAEVGVCRPSSPCRFRFRGSLPPPPPSTIVGPARQTVPSPSLQPTITGTTTTTTTLTFVVIAVAAAIADGAVTTATMNYY